MVTRLSGYQVVGVRISEYQVKYSPDPRYPDIHILMTRYPDILYVQGF